MLKYYNKTKVVCETVKHTISLGEFAFTWICFCQLFQAISNFRLLNGQLFVRHWT